jgi:hypothetical protein
MHHFDAEAGAPPFLKKKASFARLLKRQTSWEPIINCVLSTGSGAVVLSVSYAPLIL